MKKSKQKILLILIFLILITVSTSVLADTLTVTTTAAKKEINIGDTTTVSVNWQKDMQAADFVLSYDNTMLKLKSTNVPEGNYANKDGKIKVMWYSSSITPEDKKEFTFVFEGIAAGEAKIDFVVEGGFATGNLEKPDDYKLEASKTTITVLGANNGNNETGNQNGGAGTGNQNGGTGTGNQNDGAETGNQNGGAGTGNQNDGAGTGNQNDGAGTGNQNDGTETGKQNSGTTNPTKKPTKIPKAGKIHFVGILMFFVLGISFFAHKLIKYKDI